MTDTKNPATPAGSNGVNLTDDQLTAIAAYWRGCINRKQHPETNNRGWLNDERELYVFACGQMDGFERALSILFGDPFDVIDQAASHLKPVASGATLTQTHGQPGGVL